MTLLTRYRLGRGILNAAIILCIMEGIIFFAIDGWRINAVERWAYNANILLALIGLLVMLVVGHQAVKLVLISNRSLMDLIQPCTETEVYRKTIAGLILIHETSSTNDGLHLFLGRRNELEIVFIRFAFNRKTQQWGVGDQYWESSVQDMTKKIMDTLA